MNISEHFFFKPLDKIAKDRGKAQKTEERPGFVPGFYGDLLLCYVSSVSTILIVLACWILSQFWSCLRVCLQVLTCLIENNFPLPP
jgi:hypothetical protein